MKTDKIYLVYPDAALPAEPEAAFFSKNAAQNYMSRFKLNPMFAMLEVTPTEKFVSDNARSPYVVRFGTEYEVTINIIESYIYETIDKRLEKGYYVSDDNFVVVYLLATDEAEALAKAVPIKNKLIADGEWNYFDNDSLEYSDDYH